VCICIIIAESDYYNTKDLNTFIFIQYFNIKNTSNNNLFLFLQILSIVNFKYFKTNNKMFLIQAYEIQFKVLSYQTLNNHNIIQLHKSYTFYSNLITP